MASINLIDSFAEFKDAEDIDRPTLIKVIEDVFKTLIRKKYYSDENFDVIVNDQTGDLEIFQRREVVDDADIMNDDTQIELTEAKKMDDSYDVGDEVYEEVKMETFGRRAILAAKQTLASRISELKKNILLDKYKERENEIITGEVYQVWKKEIMLLDDEGNELILPKSEQIPSDYFKKGETVRAVVKKVELRGSGVVIILSRTHPNFLAKLLEIEVPEIMDGLISIKKIVREPGERAKVAVESYDDRIDPVGACVGMKGSRIHGIVRELKNENIDIINFTQNIQLLLQRSLTPAKISSMNIDETNKYAEIFMKADQVSLAIGKRGVNIKLAQELTGFNIDVFRDDLEEGGEFDIDLDEFTDEIDGWVIDELKKVGCDTARSVLNLTDDELIRRADLEVETIKEVKEILQREFDVEENEK
ncbi:MAG: transcription termination/antitermination protein NusA [Bacteroidetes bacterium]|jgi:N utilization substance protein A|nr:transcription termination/antitermination protein NusA [Bacteroidota bacterium]MBK7040600.1 transcription termination/antitermination protein NusA [Bacteroidota bacterium]MBK7589661.1 transcription termination/antitermination protein NusA [Bacteroidota bacterium]MBK8328421.1 transcription termination/antitermination protein NusA [Bacteroidota bacterium]MBK9300369.1 transcription termination/antitermination protein NusA [Bacteroidota bacterium]